MQSLLQHRFVLLSFMLIIAFTWVAVSVKNSATLKKDTITVLAGTLTLEALVADTFQSRAIGLSGRSSLKDNEGMLFVFDTSEYHGFWMKDMNFSIDILWIGDDYRINTILSGVKPESFPEVYLPKAASRHVLELPAGTSARYGLKIGDQVYFSLPKK